MTSRCFASDDWLCQKFNGGDCLIEWSTRKDKMKMFSESDFVPLFGYYFVLLPLLTSLS